MVKVTNDIEKLVKTAVKLNFDLLLAKMKERDDDNGGEPLNAVDTGYHLAVTHMKEEIEDILSRD